MAKRWTREFTNNEIRAGLRVFVTRVNNGSITSADFDMRAVFVLAGARATCGSRGCIGGHVGLILGLHHKEATSFVYGVDRRGPGGHDLVEAEHPLSYLFYPPKASPAWRSGIDAAARRVKAFLRKYPAD